MKSYFISDLTANLELVNEAFLLQEVGRRKTKDGRPYLLCTLRDKTGQINAVFWNVPDYIDSWAQSGKVALITGKVSRYKDALQVNITDLNIESSPDLAIFLPTSQRSREEMVDELTERIGTLSEPWQSLLSDLLLQEPFHSKFVNAPAARGMHHAYLGGLLEHTLSMAAIGEHLAQHYSYVNKDLLLAGTLLHDMGKAIEYDVHTSFGFSEDGRLVGHIVRAIVMVETAAQKHNIPEDQLRELVHLIASHHGKLEWGSPMQPKTLEAILLHQIDLLDSRIQGFFDHLSNDIGGGEWSAKSSMMFGVELRRPPNFVPHRDSNQ
ncbi:MAG: HD domain-containing protein [Chloroflexota bacterium]